MSQFGTTEKSVHVRLKSAMQGKTDASRELTRGYYDDRFAIEGRLAHATDLDGLLAVDAVVSGGPAMSFPDCAGAELATVNGIEDVLRASSDFDLRSLLYQLGLHFSRGGTAAHPSTAQNPARSAQWDAVDLVPRLDRSTGKVADSLTDRALDESAAQDLLTFGKISITSEILKKIKSLRRARRDSNS
jgi:hypothetical protein